MLAVLIILLSLSFSDSYTGYLRFTETSFCMDQCSMYYLEAEDGQFLTNITTPILHYTDQGYDNHLDPYLNRYVSVEGEEIWCVECGAILVASIFISSDCEFPVPCFADPCEVAEECELNTPVECIPNYCDGCYADFYDLEGIFVDCYNNVISPCDDIDNVFFGVCDMFLGYAVVYGECNGVSGCGWESSGIDYSDAFFDTIEDCESSCLEPPYVCEDIEYSYDQLHSAEYACNVDNDCMAVWGDCDIGLGGCHYSVNEELYPEEEINHLVEQWQNSDCSGGVCDCMDSPYAQCIGGICISAYCQGDNPAGCNQTGCDDGYICIDNLSACTPSTCFCNDDDFYGYWYCTEDCGGGSCSILGDINQDSSINVVDIISIVNIILESNYNILGDVNQDNNLNVSDIVILINIILGD